MFLALLTKPIEQKNRGEKRKKKMKMAFKFSYSKFEQYFYSNNLESVRVLFIAY